MPVRSRPLDTHIEITFRQAGQPGQALLATRFGPLRLYLGQLCDGIGRHAVSLNDLHLPTGYVAVEEILRFCIADLGVRLRSREWDRILLDSALVTT